MNHNTTNNIKQNENRLITSLEELKLEAISLFKSTKQKIQIYSSNLDPRILNHPRIELAIKTFVRSSRYARVEILIYDERNLQNVDHRLIRLTQIFTSSIQIKIVAKNFQNNPFAFYLIDQRRMLYRSNGERFETEFLQVPNAKVNQKSKLFDDIWQQSDPAIHLRALHI